MREVVLDTETTGFEPADGHRIVEIGCVELMEHLPTGKTYRAYLNPERLVPLETQRVHGLTDEFLADKPLFATIADELLEFIADAEVIIHNAAFDVAFLNEELARLRRGPFTRHVAKVTDSLSMAREMFPGKANSLDALCKRLEVDNSNRALHGALLDAGLLAEVYIRMTRGQDSLVIDIHDDARGRVEVAAVDLSSFALPVPAASPEEAAAHEALLADLDKACGAAAIWRTAVA
jgi:DNA polymerase-3 subunit epsilon